MWEGARKGTAGEGMSRETLGGGGGLGVGAGWEGLSEAREKQIQSPKLEDCKINSVLFPLGPGKS